MTRLINKNQVKHISITYCNKCHKKIYSIVYRRDRNLSNIYLNGDINFCKCKKRKD